MRTNQHPVDTAAPLPDDHMETTAAQYAAHATAAYWFEAARAQELTVATNAASPHAPDAYALRDAKYALAHLTNALRQFAPDVADEVIRDLLSRQSTILGAELTIGKWADMAGIDVDALQAAGEQAARATT